MWQLRSNRHLDTLAVQCQVWVLKYYTQCTHISLLYVVNTHIYLYDVLIAFPLACPGLGKLCYLRRNMIWRWSFYSIYVKCLNLILFSLNIFRKQFSDCLRAARLAHILCTGIHPLDMTVKNYSLDLQSFHLWLSSSVSLFRLSSHGSI